MNLDPLVGWMPQHAGTQALSDRWLAHNERGGKLVQGGPTPTHSIFASGSGSRKRHVAVEGEVSLVSAGAPMLMSVASSPLRS
jgi:hypothetical protein